MDETSQPNANKRENGSQVPQCQFRASRRCVKHFRKKSFWRELRFPHLGVFSRAFSRPAGIGSFHAQPEAPARWLFAGASGWALNNWRDCAILNRDRHFAGRTGGRANAQYLTGECPRKKSTDQIARERYAHGKH
jgi:hypothetical protein